MTGDPFRTAELRGAAWSAWSTSTTRFREDANLESDHARTHYRDRVVVELAQNAADAAANAGVAGRLSLRLTRAADGVWELVAANTGTPLDEAGVRSLASLRASAKATEADAVGRFGVGFAAVRSVADDVVIGAGERAVAFSLRLAAEEFAAAPALATEAAARGRDLPLLRLPYPAQIAVPEGYDTAVLLRLRDEDAAMAVRAQLDAVSDVLLLALPALAEIVVETETSDLLSQSGAVRRVADVAERWQIESRMGPIDPAFVADRPPEDRPAAWALTWAVPRDGSLPPGRYHAPTPTEEPCGLGALLIATFPLDPSRRRVVPGPLTELLAGEAGRAYADLLAALAAQGLPVLGLVPVGLPAGDLDALVRAAALEALRYVPVLPGPPGMAAVVPNDAVVIDGPLGADLAVAAALPLEGVAVPGPGDTATARALGARLLSLADAVTEVGTLDADAVWALCDALAPHAGSRGVLDAVACLRVPLADGAVAPGPRGLLLPGSESAFGAALAAVPGLRVIAAGAAHPLLARAGAVAADGPEAADALRGVVDDLVAVADDGEEVDPDVVDGVLGVVSAIVEAGHELPFWWGELPLPTSVGDVAARECVLPGSWAADVFDGLELLADDIVERYGVDTLIALGVVHDVGVWQVRDAVTPSDEVDLDPQGPQSWLAHWADYLDYLADALGPGVLLGDLTAVADLDAVADDSRARFLARMATSSDARAALLDRVRPLAGGHGGDALSYTAWWWREELGAPFARTPAVAFLPPPPTELVGLDDRVTGALGVVDSLGELEADGWRRLSDALPPPGEVVDALDAVAVWRALPEGASGGRGGGAHAGPDRLPAIVGDTVLVVEVADLVVASDPMWAPLRAVLPIPAETGSVASWLDADVSPDAPAPDSPGIRRVLDPAVARVAGIEQWWEHTQLRVNGTAVDWWVEAGPEGLRVHAVDPVSLAAGLAVAAGGYGLRHLVGAVLADPEAAQRLVVQFAWDARCAVRPEDRR